jgi:hypothetical protein
MADKISYPQIPSTVWWGVRNLLQRTPNAAIDERTLGVHLDVQEAAARQYVVELKRVGILTDEGRATPLAQKWRHDETYEEAVREILSQVYPESLIQIAPPGDVDRQKVISWFTREGLGVGTAGNKTATYMLISSQRPNELPSRAGTGSAKPARREAAPARRQDTQRAVAAKSRGDQQGAQERQNPPRPDQFPLNVNMQIHISADASSDQIESIFAAMRRYLYDGAA